MKAKERIPHICKFKKTCKTLDLLYPPTLKFSKIRRKFRELILVSEENGRRCFTPQGTAGYIYQKEKQLNQSFHVIHPYSKFCQIWESIAIMEYCFGYILRSFLISFVSYIFPTYEYQILSLLSDLFQTADVFLRFNIGYIDKETQEVVLESRKVVAHTLKRFSFYTDAIVSFPFDFIVYLYWSFGCPFHHIFTCCVLLKIVKVYSISRYLLHMSKIYNWNDVRMRIIWMLFFNFLIVHCITCAFYLLISIDSDGYSYLMDPNDVAIFRYVKVFFITTCIYFDQDAVEGKFPLENLAQKLSYSFMVIILNFNCIIFYGTFIHLLAFTRDSKMYCRAIKQEIQKFLAQENLPKNIHEKALKYLNFRYCHGYFNEEKIQQTLSPPLRREVVKFLCLNLLKRPESIFNSLPDDLVVDLSLLMKLEYFLPGDLIYKLGSRARNLYFIFSGSVAAYSPYGREIIHWYEGQDFGASSFLRKAVHPLTVIALEMTELYVLKYSDIMYTLRQQPKYAAQVTQAALKRVKLITDLYFKELTDVIFQDTQS